MSSFTLIYYYVPEDGETQAELNTYGIPISKEHLTLKAIKASFPLKGKYTFRFLTKHNKTNIFIDLLNEEDHVPLTEKRVIVKANRINWEQAKPSTPKSNKPKVSEEKQKDTFDFEFN